MSKLNARAVAILRAAPIDDGRPAEACTTWYANRCLPGVSTSQARATLRLLERKGFMETARGACLFRITSSGIQWLRSLDAGRPWMVRGYKR